MKTYDLSNELIHKIANLCKQEQGSITGAKAEASLTANLLETNAYYARRYGTDIYSFMRTSGWFSQAAYWMDNGNAGEAYDKAIREVLVNGDRTLPIFVDEHDSIRDISSAKNNGKEIDKTDRTAYVRDVTVIKNVYGSTYTFWTFPTADSDPFGYTDKELRKKSNAAPTAQEIIDKAVSFLGRSEPSGDDYFIRYYNNITGSRFSMEDAWCAMFVSSVARMVNVRSDVIPNFADCDAGVAWFKAKGRYERSAAYGGTYIPSAADVVFYSAGHIQADSTHTGFVVQAQNGQLLAIEGNHSDRVGYRNIALTDAYIIGYGRVGEYLSKGNGSQNSEYIRNLYLTLLERNPSEAEVQSWVKVLDAGTSREDVKIDFLNSEEYRTLHHVTDIYAGNIKTFQYWLRTNYSLTLAVDGRCGPATKAAAVKAMQLFLNRNYYAGLEIDGKFGPKTQKAFRSVKKGARGANVYIVQGLLYGCGHDPDGFDGIFGQGCKSAVLKFQKNHQLEDDGIVGSKTFAELVK